MSQSSPPSEETIENLTASSKELKAATPQSLQVTFFKNTKKHFCKKKVGNNNSTFDGCDDALLIYGTPKSSTVESRFKKARFKKESRFKKDWWYNQFFST